MAEKIFVQIASYRDSELVPTIRDLLDKAKNPKALTFGICWQRDEKESLKEFARQKRFRIIDVPWHESKGLCWARSLIQTLYKDEEWTLQLDSHHRFAENWDEELINMAKDVSKESPKMIIGSYAGVYDPATNKKTTVEPYKMVADDFTSHGTILFRPHTIPNWQNLKYPVKARFVSGHYFFTIGQHCKEYKYDPNIYFAGDEISLSIRSFTLGYDLYHPHKNLVWHEYMRLHRRKHWDDHAEENKNKGVIPKLWHQIDSDGKMRLRQMLGEEDNGIDLDVYGLGNVRTHAEYERYAGIDFANRRLQQAAIDGIDPPTPYTNPEDWEAGFSRTTNLTLRWTKQDVDPADDYDFWAFCIEDKSGALLHRIDFNINDGPQYLNFNTLELPVTVRSNRKVGKWILWPHSASKGWLQRKDFNL